MDAVGADKVAGWWRSTKRTKIKKGRSASQRGPSTLHTLAHSVLDVLLYAILYDMDVLF